MKNLTLSLTFLLVCFSASAQMGITAGIAGSYYSRGDNTYSGLEHGKVGLKAGVYNKIGLSRNTDLQVELDFISLGAKNPKEAPETFTTYHIHLPVTISQKIGKFNIQAGGFVNRMIYAKNHTFSGVNTFGWSVEKWDYMKKLRFGAIAGVGYDFTGLIVEAKYMHGLTKVQKIAWDYDQKKLGYDAAFELSAYFPFRIK